MAAIDHTDKLPGAVVSVTLTNANQAYEVHLSRGVGAAIVEAKANAAKWAQAGTEAVTLGTACFTLSADTPTEVPLDRVEDGKTVVKLFLESATGGTVVALTPRPRAA